MGLEVPQVVTVSAVYTKTNPIPAQLGGAVSGTFHEPRTVDSVTADIAFAAAGFVDMGLEVAHDLTAGVDPVTVKATIRAHAIGMGDLGTLLGHQFAVELIPSGGLWFFQSEKSTALLVGQFEDSLHHVAEVPEFRLPYRFLRLGLTPFLADGITPATPDAGQVVVAITKRA